MKVVTILGTRPEIIRLSRVMAALDQTVDHRLVHTGQNYDYELNEVFFHDLGVKRPSHFLEIDTSSLGTALGGILTNIEPVLREERPDAVLVLGDTNSCLAAIMAKRMNIPVYHMEAGNRCYDENVPEETNRRIIDHLADFNLAYTEHARRNLLAEGLHPRRIYVTGSPLNEVLTHYRPRFDEATTLADLGLEPHAYFIVSIHREENVDNRANLVTLVDALTRLSDRFHLPLIVSTHPRTRSRLEALGIDVGSRDIRFCRPFGFHAYNQLQLNAFCAISDSGSISEESAILGFPAVTVRNAMERPEALDAGSIVISGLDSDVIINCVETVTAQFGRGQRPDIPDDYRMTNTSQRVVNLIVGTAKLSRQWSGRRPTEDFRSAGPD